VKTTRSPWGEVSKSSTIKRVTDEKVKNPVDEKGSKSARPKRPGRGRTKKNNKNRKKQPKEKKKKNRLGIKINSPNCRWGKAGV